MLQQTQNKKFYENLQQASNHCTKQRKEIETPDAVARLYAARLSPTALQSEVKTNFSVSNGSKKTRS